MTARFDVAVVGGGLGALVAELDFAPSRFARRFVIRRDVGSDGTIREIHIVSATAKLAGVSPLAEDAPRT